MFRCPDMTTYAAEVKIKWTSYADSDLRAAIFKLSSCEKILSFNWICHLTAGSWQEWFTFM